MQKAVAAQQRVFFPNLDGLRFCCFLAVFLFHSFYTESPEMLHSRAYRFVKHGLFGNGNIGVNFFFVLSGFLITYLLIAEKKFHGSIDVKKFWLRRILRIWPLYYACVAFGFFIFPLLKTWFGQTPHETAHLAAYLTFTNNFDFIRNGLPDASVLGVLWSIAVEEQFYFVWPLLLFIIPEKHYPKLFIALVAGSWVFRYFYAQPLYYEHHTLSCMGDLAIGALGAYYSHKDSFRARIENLPKAFIIFLYVAFAILFFFRAPLLRSNFYVAVFERSFIACFILLIILEQNFAKNSFFKMKNMKLLSRLGTISYGLYCLHFIGILITLYTCRLLHIDNNNWEVLLLQTPVALLLSIIISRLSYDWFESRFLRLKEKFAYITR